MKNIILLALTCFFINQGIAQGKLTIMNTTTDYELFIEPIASKPNGCFPEITMRSNFPNNYYLKVDPSQTMIFNDFSAFANYNPGIDVLLKMTSTSSWILPALQPAQVSGYSSILTWNRFIFKSFTTMGMAGVSSHIGVLPNLCHTLQDYASDTYSGTFASTFTSLGETFFIIS